LIETEFWQPGRVINKIKTHTHLEVKNYWTPLDEEEDEEEEHQLDSIHKIEITTTMPPILQGCKSKGLWTVTVKTQSK
jgi:hypothetical protein